MSKKQKESHRAAVLRNSDERIANACEELNSHHRGKQALADFRTLAKGSANGLDLQGMQALKVLVEEWADGRRDFLDTLPSCDDSILEALKDLRGALSDFRGHGMPGFTDRAVAYLVMEQADRALKSKPARPTLRRFQVFLRGSCHRNVDAHSVAEACDTARALDSQEGKFYEVELYTASPV